MAHTTSMEEQIANLTSNMLRLMKMYEEREAKLDILLTKDDVAEPSDADAKRHREYEECSKMLVLKQTCPKSIVKELPKINDFKLPATNVKELINQAIKEKLEEKTRTSSSYVKPYTSRINALKMPEDYQPPKFQQFDGSGNPKQHIAHFIETCNSVGTHGDQLVKQFVRSLKDNAFDWYSDLGANSIDNWDQLQMQFLGRFYSTRRIAFATGPNYQWSLPQITIPVDGIIFN